MQLDDALVIVVVVVVVVAAAAAAAAAVCVIIYGCESDGPRAYRRVRHTSKSSRIRRPLEQAAKRSGRSFLIRA